MGRQEGLLPVYEGEQNTYGDDGRENNGVLAPPGPRQRKLQSRKSSTGFLIKIPFRTHLGPQSHRDRTSLRFSELVPLLFPPPVPSPTPPYFFSIPHPHLFFPPVFLFTLTGPSRHVFPLPPPNPSQTFILIEIYIYICGSKSTFSSSSCVYAHLHYRFCTYMFTSESNLFLYV